MISRENWQKDWLNCVREMSNGRDEEAISQFSTRDILITYIVRGVVAEAIAHMSGVNLKDINTRMRRLINITASRQMKK